MSSLRYPDYPLLEKTNIFLLYKAWSSRKDLVNASKVIAKECSEYVSDDSRKSRYQRTLHHFKADLLAQLYRETHQRQKYVGLKTFIEFSSGLPRNLLILLKHIYAWAAFNGELPFSETPITIRSQQAGVSAASDWFYNDARMLGRDGQHVMDGISRLGTLFRSIRFSDKPSECSCSTFSVDVSRCTEEARRILNLAENWSLLIDVGSQRDRNTERIDLKYQLNRMLAPRWDLSIYRRGVLALSPAEINAIFDPAHNSEFDSLSNARVTRMNAPFEKRRLRKQEPKLGESSDGLFKE